MFRIIFSLVAVLALGGCLDLTDGDNGDDNNGGATPDTVNYIAAVATTAPDFSSGAHALIGTLDGELVTHNDVAPTHSDVTMSAYDGKAYRIERFMGANVTRFPGDDTTSTPDWQYSVVDQGDTAASTNPTNMIFASATKAYVPRYEKTTLAIVNPAATSASDFRLGELDLGQYVDGDGIPEMHNGVVADGKLFVVLQRLDRSDAFNWVPTNTAFVAVFDVATDSEIDTGQDASTDCNGAACLGIPLTIRNPNNDIVYLADENAIYVQGAGNLFGPTGAGTGGVERIDVASYATQLVVDDDGVGATHGQTAGIAIKSATEAYLIGNDGFFDNTLYPFDPSTGVVGAALLGAFTSIDIADIIIGPAGNLWVSDGSNATVHLIDATTNTVIDAVVTNLNPAQVAFF